MDLTTIKKKIKLCRYKRISDFTEDLDLILKNCKIYNADGSDVYKICEVAEKKTKKIIKKVLKSKKKFLVSSKEMKL